ncbi:MAG: hypothetical protein N2V75_04235 [Methanophagales archaeon]|nr:hypothetical protein [Methanophagales archaeon]
MAISIEERLSKVEGTVSEHDRIFDMIHAEIRDVKVSVDNRIDDFREDMNRRFDDAKEETNRGFGDMNKRFDEMNKRFDETNKRIDSLDGSIDETNKRIAEMDSRLTSRMDSTLKWIVAIQIPTWMMIITMWVTIILRIE